MQAINLAIVNPVFLSVFLGTAILGVAATILIAVQREMVVGWETAAGTALYLVGVLFVTMGINVPLNNALARVSPETSGGVQFWRVYQARWTAWNHVRTIAGLAAAIMFSLAG
jgi:uncharacterized membrane protein